MTAVFEEIDEGSVTPGSLGTYDDLTNTTDPGNYWLTISLENLLNDETLTLRIRLKVRSSSSLAVFVERDYTDAQPEPLVQYGPIASAHELDVDIRQTGGTLRAYPFSLMKEISDETQVELIDDAITAAKIDTDAITAASLAADAVDEIVADIVAAGLDGSISSVLTAIATRAAPGDAMDLVANAVDASALAADAVDEIVADIVAAGLDDSISNVLAAIATRAAPGDAMDLVADALDASALATSAVNELVDQVWDEILSGHLGAGTTGEALSLASTGGGGGGGATAGDVWEYVTRQVQGNNKAGSMLTQCADLAYKSRRSLNVILQQLGQSGQQE